MVNKSITNGAMWKKTGCRCLLRRDVKKVADRTGDEPGFQKSNLIPPDIKVKSRRIGGQLI